MTVIGDLVAAVGALLLLAVAGAAIAREVRAGRDDRRRARQIAAANRWRAEVGARRAADERTREARR